MEKHQMQGNRTRWLVSAILATGLVLAASALSAQEGTAESAKKALLAKNKNLPQDLIVKKTPFPGLFQVNLYGKPAYIDGTATFMVVGGSVIDMAKLEDYSVKTLPDVVREFYKALPLNGALKSIYGKGERTLVTFEDPECEFCQEQNRIFEKNAQTLNMTVYTFLIPLTGIHPNAERMSRQVLCSPNPSQAWRNWMGKGTKLPEKDNCPEAKRLDEMRNLAINMGINSTPRLFFPNGMQSVGQIEASKVIEAFDVVGRLETERQEKDKPAAAVAPAVPAKAPAAQKAAPAAKK